MSWLPGADPSLPAFESFLAQRPELLTLYKRFYGTHWDDNLLPRRVLELCRTRVAQLHDCQAELAIRDASAGVSESDYDAIADWEHSPCFSAPEKSALAIAEKMPWRHHDLEDSEYAELRNHFDEPQVVALTVALALFDANCRLRLVFELTPSPALSAPTASGPLH